MQEKIQHVQIKCNYLDPEINNGLNRGWWLGEVVFVRGWPSNEGCIRSTGFASWIEISFIICSASKLLTGFLTAAVHWCVDAFFASFCLRLCIHARYLYIRVAKEIFWSG